MKTASPILVGTALVAAPFVAEAMHSGWPLPTRIASLAAGAVVLAGSSIVVAVTRLYRKTTASEAFVRTGVGGVRVIRDGGALVIPVLHDVTCVSLRTIKLEVERENEDALITADKLRADVRAEFYVRVQPDAESILQAARSLGDRVSGSGADAVEHLVEDKLVSSLRTAAASKSLEQLNSERDAFLAEVMGLVSDDLRSNGLVLESVTISKLDQTDERFLKAENIFDAQGKRKIAEITQQNLTERNQLVRDGERLRLEQDVEAKQRSLELQRFEAESEARQGAEVAKVQTEAKREAHVRQLEAQRDVELAQVERQKSIELATHEQQRTVEVAEREKQARIAEADQRRAAAERGLAETEAERERARQSVVTVRMTEEAERAKRQRVLEAEAQAEMQFVASQRQADAAWYARQKDAEACRLAADAEAESVRRRAQAQSEAEQQRAIGDRATAMVPVDVARATLAVERERVENVVKAELEARERHGKVAQDFELAKLRIEAEKEVRIAYAGAQATVFSKVNANLYGSTDEMTRILESFTKGQSAAQLANGFFSGADDRTHDLVGKLGSSVAALASGLSARISEGSSPAPSTEPPRLSPESLEGGVPDGAAIADDDAPKAA